MTEEPTSLFEKIEDGKGARGEGGGGVRGEGEWVERVGNSPSVLSGLFT